MRLWAGSWKEIDWGSRYWLFMARYFGIPWFGFRASLSMTWYRGEHVNLLARVVNFLSNWAHFGFAIAVPLLLVRSIVAGNWVGLVALTAMIPAVWGVLAVRMQMAYRLGHFRPPEGGAMSNQGVYNAKVD